MLKKKSFYMMYFFPNILIGIDFPLIQYKYETPMVQNISAILQKIPDTYKGAHSGESYLSPHTKIVLACGAGAAVAGITATIAWWKAKQKYQDQINTLRNKHDKLKNTCNTLRNGFSLLCENAKNLNQENAMLKNKNKNLEQVEKKYTDLKQAYTYSEKECADLKQAYTRAKEDYDMECIKNGELTQKFINGLDLLIEIYFKKERPSQKNTNFEKKTGTHTIHDFSNESHYYNEAQKYFREKMELNQKLSNLCTGMMTLRIKCDTQRIERNGELLNKIEQKLAKLGHQSQNDFKDQQIQCDIERENAEYYKESLHDTLCLNIPKENSSDSEKARTDLQKAYTIVKENYNMECIKNNELKQRYDTFTNALNQLNQKKYLEKEDSSQKNVNFKKKKGVHTIQDFKNQDYDNENKELKMKLLYLCIEIATLSLESKRSTQDYREIEDSYKEKIEENEKFLNEHEQRFAKFGHQSQNDFKDQQTQYEALTGQCDIERENAEYYKELLYETLRLDVSKENSSNCTQLIMDIISQKFPNDTISGTLRNLYQECQKNDNKVKRQD